MRYLNESVEKAAKHCVEELRQDGGIGGVIALDDKGNGEFAIRVTIIGLVTTSNYCTVAMPLNCSGMYRGVIREDGIPKTAIFDDDKLD